MPEKPANRPWSASRQRRHSGRRSTSKIPDTTIDLSTLIQESPDPICGIDYRPLKEKIEDLEKKVVDLEKDSTPDEYLQCLVLLQLYARLEYGDCSIENARGYFNLAKFYLDHQDLVPQAHDHLSNARAILEQCFVHKFIEHLPHYLLAFDIYAYSIKCYLAVQQYRLQHDPKKKNRHMEKIELFRPDEDLETMERYLEKIQLLTDLKDYDEKLYELRRLKFDLILINPREFNDDVFRLNEQLFDHIDKYMPTRAKELKIKQNLRLALYLIQFNRKTQEAFECYEHAEKLAEEEEENDPSDLHKQQWANVLFQWARARVRVDRLTDDTERKLLRAIDLYRLINDQMDANALEVMDDLATFYTKVEKFQEALDILCRSVQDKQLVFGEFSDEVIMTKSRIGAIYLRECEYLNAAEHLKDCLELQEFVYGPKDSRTCQTRNALEILKKDPAVSQRFFARIQEAQRQDRRGFRFSTKISHDKEDHELLLTVKSKPPIGSKHSS